MLKGKMNLVLSLLAAAALAYGCGSKKVETTEAPQPAVEPVVAAPTAVPMGKYTVASRDTLWDIAGKTDIYSDSFQWPILFKTNRDQIVDPDLIYPKQDLGVKKDVSPEEVASARDLSSKTPKFVPHTKPRQALPVDYF